MIMADFFEPHRAYIRDEPYQPPELLDLFRCIAIATNPRNNEPRAFGFAKAVAVPDDGWYSTALTPEDWARGWVQQPDEQPPAPPTAEQDGRPLIERLAPEDAERVAALIDERDSWRREVLELRAKVAEQDGAAADAEAYRELRDEIAATMGNEWDLDEAEISILIKYVRWLAAGQPRDEDGYPIRRETYTTAAPKLRQEFGVQAEHSKSAFPTRTERVARELAAQYSRVRELGCKPTPHHAVTRYSSDWQRLPDAPAALDALDGSA
jgi:hypothetical protein